MPPKKAATKPKAEKPKVYDFTGLEKGMKVQVESDGKWYAGEVLQVKNSSKIHKPPLAKVSYKGYEGYDEWVGGARLRSKAIKATAPEAPAKKERPPLEFTFGYWEIRGLAAAFRMIFEYKGVKYTDKRYGGDGNADAWFKEDKPKILEKNPLANLPYIECGKDCVCQTNACLAYVGDKLRMSGFTYQQKLLNSQLLCEIYDVRNKMIELSYDFAGVVRNESEFKEKVEAHWKGQGAFKKFEAILEKGGTDYFVGKAPCTSDFHIWEMLDQHKILAERTGKSGFFDEIPKCKAFYDKFRALPTLQKYFESEAYKFDINNKKLAKTYFA